MARKRNRRVVRTKRGNRFTAKGRHTPSTPLGGKKGSAINAWEKNNNGGGNQPMIPCPPFCPDYKPPIYGGDYIEGETGWGGMSGQSPSYCPDGTTYCTLSCTWTNQTPTMWECVWPPNTGACVDAEGNNSYAHWDGPIYTYSQCQSVCQGGCHCESFQGDMGGQYGWAWEATHGCGSPGMCIGPPGCCQQGSTLNPSGANNC